MEPTAVLATCETLEVDLEGTFITGVVRCGGYSRVRTHAFAPSMLHLLRKLRGLRKLVVHLPEQATTCTNYCPAEGYKVDDIVLDFLEEVILLDFNGADDHLEFLSLMLACNAKNLDSISINMFSDNLSTTRKACQQRIFSIASHKKDVRFNVWLHGAWVPYVCNIK